MSIFLAGIFFRRKVIVNKVIYPCLASLNQLIASFYTVSFSAFYKMSSGLVKSKCYFFLNTLPTKIENPIVITWACINSGLAAYGNLVYIIVKIFGNVNMLKHRRYYY